MNRDHPSDGGVAEGGSGLIDLRALMEASRTVERARPAAPADGTPVPVVGNLAVYPFGAPEAQEPAPPPVPVPEVKPRRSMPMNVVIPVLGAVALAAALAGVMLAGPSPGTVEPVRAGAAAGAGQVPASGPETVAPPVTPAKVEVTPPQGAPGPSNTAVRPTPTGGPRPRPTPPVKTATVKTPPPASTCNGNLQCEIERAANKSNKR
jgi:hypothetical protein